MNTSVELQEPFSYAVWPLILVGTLVVGYLIFLIVAKILKNRKYKAPKPAVVKPKETVDIFAIKKKYMGELNKIEADLQVGKITVRVAYQRMSQCIRRFVYEVTGLKVQHYTLAEIQELRMPILEELISEYYTPEFAGKSVVAVENTYQSIEKTKRVIERWN